MIPASLLIVLAPIAAAVPALLLRRWRLLETLAALIGCAVVIFLLVYSPDAPLRLGDVIIQSSAPLNILGRELTVRPYDRLPLLLIYIVAAIVFALGARIAQGWTFIPLGLGILAALSVALMIRPFVFAGLALEAAAAMSAIMIQAERNGKGSATGALRYLIIFTLALPAFLGAGYAADRASGVADLALQAEAYAPAAILLCIALGLVFGAFPAFTWTHPVAKDAPPLATAFLASVGVAAAGFLFLGFAQDFAWFRDQPFVGDFMNLLGLLTLVLGATLGWAQRSLGRVLAAGISVEVGCMFLLLSHTAPLTVEALAFGTVARAVSLGVFALGIAMIRERAGSDEFINIAGQGRLQPWAALAIGIGGMSLAGLPGTVGFVSRWTTARVIGVHDLEALVLILVAGASVGVGMVRGLSALYATVPATSLDTEVTPISAARPNMRGRAALVTLAIALIIALGIAPGITESIIQPISSNYTFYK